MNRPMVHPSLVSIELGLRTPTIWAVVFLSIGITFGVVVARIVTRGAHLTITAPARAAAADPMPVSWPSAARAAPTPDGTPSELVVLEPTMIALDAAPHRAAHAHHRAAQAATDSTPSDVTEASEPPAETVDTEAAASVARARQELVDSL